MTKELTDKAKKYTYTGKPVPWFMPVALAEGWDDGKFFPRHDQTNLYRYPHWKKILWRIGYVAALKAVSKGRPG